MLVLHSAAFFTFYRATLCVSAVFAVARCGVRPSLPPSVGMSVTFVHSIQTAEDIVKLPCRLGSPIILVFLTTGTDTQFQGEPLQRIWYRRKLGR